MKGKMYGIGVVMVVFGAAGMAEHITSNRGSFPICAVVLGIGLILMLMSYENKDR